MAEIPHDASHATTSRYEMRWLALALGALAIILSISIGFMLANPGRIPLMAMVAMTTADVLAHPGLTRVGPHAFRAVVVARQYGFTPATLDVPVGSRVDFYVTSADVTHGFEIPGGNVNVEVFPGYVAHVMRRSANSARTAPSAINTAGSAIRPCSATSLSSRRPHTPRACARRRSPPARRRRGGLRLELRELSSSERPGCCRRLSATRRLARRLHEGCGRSRRARARPRRWAQRFDPCKRCDV